MMYKKEGIINSEIRQKEELGFIIMYILCKPVNEVCLDDCWEQEQNSCATMENPQCSFVFT